VPNLRGVKTLVLGSRVDFPMYRLYDWTLSSEGHDQRVVCSGRMCKPPEEVDQEQESELLAFLNNAPIAMHWLSGTGHVLWCNQTELDVLGYTKEEYFGKPIMDFCPVLRALSLSLSLSLSLCLSLFLSLSLSVVRAELHGRFAEGGGRLLMSEVPL